MLLERPRFTTTTADDGKTAFPLTFFFIDDFCHTSAAILPISQGRRNTFLQDFSCVFMSLSYVCSGNHFFLVERAELICTFAVFYFSKINKFLLSPFEMFIRLQ